MNFGFPVFVISLPYRNDRRTQLVENWESRGFDTSSIQWIDGIRPEADDIRWSEMKGMEAYGNAENLRKIYVVGAVGCKRAGVSALDAFLANGSDWGLICQDDCHWTEDAAYIIRKTLDERPSDTDALYFSAHSRKDNEVVGINTIRLGGARNCTAVLYRRTYALEMLPRLRACDCEWDLFMEREHARGRFYCAMPMPAYQEESFSDITQRVIKNAHR